VFRKSMILHLQTSRHDEPEAVRALGALRWWAYSTADMYLSVSPGLTHSYLAAGLPADRIRDVPNGVDEVRFAPASAEQRRTHRRALGLPLDGPILLYVGTFTGDKQPHVLMEAWLRLQAGTASVSTLVCVGATSPRQFEADARLAVRLREEADRAGVGDRLVLVEPTHQIEDYFRAADVFILPSAREGLPIVLLEAMAAGLPCVASRLPGSTDAIVEDGVNGRLVEPGNATAFAEALRDVLGSPAQAARLGMAARATVEKRYTMSHVASMWLDAYAEVLRHR
jgi:glycosyltransferase involved in cell wall biosynthesis